MIAYRNGAPVMLRDVGRAIDSIEDSEQAAWFQGVPAVLLDIQRQPSANTINVVDAVKAVLPRLQASLPATLKVSVVTDRTTTIRAAIAEVQFTLVLTVALVVMVIFVFLRKFWATVIPSVTLPVSLVAIDPITNRYRGVMVELVDAKGKRKFWEGMEGITDANGSKIPTGPVATATRRGTLQHLALQGKKLIRSAGTGEIIVGVQARVDLESFAKERVPYALAVTLEMAQPLRQGLNADVAGRVRLKQRIEAPRPQTRVRT